MGTCFQAVGVNEGVDVLECFPLDVFGDGPTAPWAEDVWIHAGTAIADVVIEATGMKRLVACSVCGERVRHGDTIQADAAIGAALAGTRALLEVDFRVV